MNLKSEETYECGRRPSIERDGEPDQEINRMVTLLKANGLGHPDLEGFARHLSRSDRLRRRCTQAATNPDRSDQDILELIQDAASLDEALWRAFLAGHFGHASLSKSDRSQIESAGRFLCGFDKQVIWTWSRVETGLEPFKTWLTSHANELSTLKFGNHRKYESTKPEILFRVISSFVDWVRSYGGVPSRAFAISNDIGPEMGFDVLFKRLKVHRFGRTGRFDLLCLIGDLDLINIRPGSCYLEGSTGPLRGARELMGKTKTAAELTRLADRIAKQMGIDVAIFEDALCNWQKQRMS